VFTSGLYAILYKVLPDARIRWRDVAVGAAFTAGLFLVGRFSITYYISHSNLNHAYGAAVNAAPTATSRHRMRASGSTL
ncbi:MAG: hypothetical protein EOO62_40160, partial [Hymenobacter sp.]